VHPDGNRFIALDDLAESLAEGFVTSATSAEGAGEETRNAILTEEIGGPFSRSPRCESSTPSRTHPAQLTQRSKRSLRRSAVMVELRQDATS